MRLIDADVLKENLAEAVTKRFEKWDKTVLVCEMETFTRDIINNTPTVIWCGGSSEGLPIMDLRPRPQGKWIERTERITLDTYYECSNCKEPWTTIEGTPWDNGMNFCPNCGARMKCGNV